MTVALLSAGNSEALEKAQVDLAASGHTVFPTGSPVDADGNYLPADEVYAWVACAMATIDSCAAAFVVNPRRSVLREVVAQVVYAALHGKAVRYVRQLPLGIAGGELG